MRFVECINEPVQEEEKKTNEWKNKSFSNIQNKKQKI